MSDQKRNELLFRTYMVLGLVVLLGVAIIGRVAQIQWVQGEKWRSRGNDLIIRAQKVEAEMGSILSEGDVILASSTARFEVRVDLVSSAMRPEDFNSHVDSLGWYLSKYVDSGKSPAEWTRQLRVGRKKGKRNFLITKDADYEDLQRIKSFPLFRLGKYKGGLCIFEHMNRARNFGPLARRTIGVYREGQPSFGLEATYKDVLIGESGMRMMQVLPGNVRLPLHDLTEISPKPGKDIVTTLDMGMQDMADKVLREALARHQAASGSVVVMEVKTGKIRAMVNLDRDGEGFSEQYNHSVGSAVELGSIFKLASYMALIEDGHIGSEDLVDINKGKERFYDQEVKDAHEHGLDTVTVQQAFEMSSNVGVAKLVQRYYGASPQSFYDRLEDFGLTQPVGIDLLGEARPRIPHPEQDKKHWNGITLPWMSMGYEVHLTPLQMLSLYGAVANGGRMMKPMLVSEIRSQGETVRKIHPTVLHRKIASSGTLRVMRSMLEGVVDSGTAKLWHTSRYRFAGKTGTAQIRDKKSDNKMYRASFVGYFPAEEPLYAAVVVINELSGYGYYGSEVALPVFRRVADYCFQSRREMFPRFQEEDDREFATWRVPQWESGFRSDLQKVCKEVRVPYDNQSDSEWATTARNEDGDRLLLKNRNCPQNIVPNVVGMGLRDALFALENQGLKVDASGVGKVRRQSVASGSPARGQYVRIYLE